MDREPSAHVCTTVSTLMGLFGPPGNLPSHVHDFHIFSKTSEPGGFDLWRKTSAKRDFNSIDTVTKCFASIT